MKRRDPQSIAQIIDAVVEQAGLTQTMAEQRACYLWPEVVGQGINRYTSRRYVENGVLHVFITSAPLRSELTTLRQRILDDLNRRAGASLTDIRIH